MIRETKEKLLKEISLLRNQKADLESKFRSLENDLAFQNTKVRESEAKYTTEIDSMRAKLKSSQNEIFLKL